MVWLVVAENWMRGPGEEEKTGVDRKEGGVMAFDDDVILSAIPCPKCGGKVYCRRWDSCDGAYTDYRCVCIERDCDYFVWEEGADA